MKINRLLWVCLFALPSVGFSQLSATVGIQYRKESLNFSSSTSLDDPFDDMFTFSGGVSMERNGWQYGAVLSYTGMEQMQQHYESYEVYTGQGGSFYTRETTRMAEVRIDYAGLRLSVDRIVNANGRLQFLVGMYGHLDCRMNYRESHFLTVIQYSSSSGNSTTVSRDPFTVLYKPKSLFPYAGIVFGPRLTVGRCRIELRASFDMLQRRYLNLMAQPTYSIPEYDESKLVFGASFGLRLIRTF